VGNFPVFVFPASFKISSCQSAYLAGIFNAFPLNKRMNFYGISLAFVIAVLLTAVFTIALNSKKSLSAIWIFFLIVFLASWAAQLWVKPIGPKLLGVAWVPSLFAAILFSFILAASSIKPVRFSRAKAKDMPTETVTATIGIFLWLLLVILVLAIVAGYYKTSLLALFLP